MNSIVRNVSGENQFIAEIFEFRTHATKKQLTDIQIILDKITISVFELSEIFHQANFYICSSEMSNDQFDVRAF